MDFPLFSRKSSIDKEVKVMCFSRPIQLICLCLCDVFVRRQSGCEPRELLFSSSALRLGGVKLEETVNGHVM